MHRMSEQFERLVFKNRALFFGRGDILNSRKASTFHEKLFRSHAQCKGRVSLGATTLVYIGRLVLKKTVFLRGRVHVS